MQAANFYTVDVEKHSMDVGLRCWPTNQDYNNGKDCSASIATYAHEAPGAANDGEVHCSADSLHKGGSAAAATAAAAIESPPEEAPCAAAPQVQCLAHIQRKRLSASAQALSVCLSHSRHQSATATTAAASESP